MSTTYTKCSDYKPFDEASFIPVAEMARDLMAQFECYQELIDCHPKIDYLFAFNDEGAPLKKNGLRCLGICRKTSLKERAAGRGDIEIILDGEWWNNRKETTDKQRRAILDHELWHIGPSRETDDLGRPKFWIRRHDFEVGLFSVIAARHGKHSLEQMVMKRLREEKGSYYWPDLFGQPPIEARRGGQMLMFPTEAEHKETVTAAKEPAGQEE